MKFGRNKTRRRVVLKIIFVWLLSIAMSLPLSLMYSQVSFKKNSIKKIFPLFFIEIRFPSMNKKKRKVAYNAEKVVKD